MVVSPPSQAAAAVSILVIIVTSALYNMLFSRKWDPRGKHCLITGGSRGTGLALAILLAKRGAHVSIVARDKPRLDKGLEGLERVRQDPKQIFRAYSFAVDSETGSAAALKAAGEPHGGRCPEALFLCAGASRPGFFIDQTEESFMGGIQMTLGAQAFTALATTKEMVRQGVKGKIVFVSSILGLMSFVGYTTYAPGKFAIRGLAETLRSELKMYGIDVHVAFPATILSPGLDEENEVKPKVTLKIEETDSGSPPEDIAAGILRGVEKGSFHITMDFFGDIFRATAAGASPRHNPVLDILYGLIGYIALPFWRKSVDAQVIGHAVEHREYCHTKGYLS
ncbi:oxidoreductase [Dichomitus squalens]|uniref:3-dehydrosphinganine reductase n=2 Tax=Dichomitus squalens TaxID=114155 RepID=A0A4Q9PD06_9APHY|nr:oxidoreductase [Dichomitus squalens]